jgi:hypothetical protein
MKFYNIFMQWKNNFTTRLHMYKQIFASSLLFIGCIVSSYTYAAEWTITLTPQRKSVTINKTTYTLDICSASEITNLRTKVALSLKNTPLTTRKKVLTQIKLLQVFWAKSCTSNLPTTPQQPLQNWFAVISNATFLNWQPANAQNKVLERAKLYQQSVEGIVDSMITQRILTSTDKEILKGKIEIQYVNNCKQIDGITTVKQRYNQDKVIVKNELVSIVLNVSTCEQENFWPLFATSYKHVFIHELGHYIYYMKDRSTKEFEDICWNGDTRRTACLSYETFYSKYAMWDPQEDYAETFAYRYQNKQPEFHLTNPNLNLTTLNIKAQHFSELFK